MALLKKKDKAVEDEAPPMEGRRYAGRKESLGYILYEASSYFNISAGGSEFLDRLVNINKKWQAILSPFMGVWVWNTPGDHPPKLIL